MPQTFYVTQDEEILSLVGRLRSSALLENVFVVPKRALILQSVVNLRILAREAEKLGKAVVIITQDNDGRMLAEKAGIATRMYSEESIGLDRQATPIQQHSEQPREQRSPVMLHRSDIGSDNFYTAEGGGSKQESIVAAPVEAPKDDHSQMMPLSSQEAVRLRIRDNTPKNLTTLNSTTIPDNPHQPMDPAMRHPEAPGELLRRNALKQVETEASQLPAGTSQGRLSNMFRDRECIPRPPSHRIEKTHAPPKGNSPVGARARFWLFLFISISIVSLLGTGALLFLPKAEITIIPKSSSQSMETELEGRKDATSESQEIPIRLIEKELEVVVSLETSENSSGNGEKAKGKATIFNEFDDEPQPLIATTRLESSGGKIFRLIRGVTVPGMSERGGKKEPGAIEVEIVADEPGEEYNIESDSFTIPGFKNSPKYSKFLAKSTEKMSGGALQGGSESRVVAASDISRAKEAAEKKFRTAFEELVRSDVSEIERFLMPSMHAEIIGSPSHPQIGVAASSFEYTSKWNGKVFVFSEEDVRRKTSDLLSSRSEGNAPVKMRDASFDYGDSVADYEKGILRIPTRVTALFVDEVDEESLKSDFLGKDEAGIKEILEKHPEVKKIDINLKPKFFSFSVPKERDRVTVLVKEQ